MSATPRGAGVARRLAGLAARLTYRDVEVLAVGDLAPGPTVLVSNHFGGLADAVLLLHASPRFPRILARDLIWRFPVARGFMRWIGAIPVRHPEDYAPGERDNDAMFAACYDALGDGSVVLIFPEGVTQDDPFLAPVRTGATRIALGARAAGVEGVTIQPVGIHYEDKAAFRSRVLVSFGTPLSVDEFAAVLPDAGRGGADDRAAVRSLTDDVSAGLRRAAPDYRDWPQAHDLHLGAEATVRALTPRADRSGRVPLALTEPVAAALARLPEDDVAGVRTAAGTYRRELAATGLDDSVLGFARAQRPPRRLVVDALLALVLLPYAVLGAALITVPYLLTQATRLIPAAPAVRATILPAVALAAFVVEWAWLTVEATTRDGPLLGAVTAVLAPAFVASTVLVAERAVLAWRSARRWWTARRRSAQLDAVRSSRTALVSEVALALRSVEP